MDSRGCSAEPGGPAKGTDSLRLIPAIALEDALSSIFERPKKGKGTHVHGGESLSKAGMETVNVPLSDFFLDYSQINDVTKNVVSLRASLRQLFDEEKLQQNAESNDSRDHIQRVEATDPELTAETPEVDVFELHKDLEKIINNANKNEALTEYRLSEYDEALTRDEKEIDLVSGLAINGIETATDDNKSRYDALAAKMIQIEKVMNGMAS